ncbi:hypothetical protein SH449x_001565 [Pirellulaceae bacterium SH449]
MAIRLPVVLSQNAKRSAAFSECEEGWITSLLFEERLDATLISDLASIQPDSTDFLCLDGLKGDFVLVTWLPGEAVLPELIRLGFESFELVPVDGSPKLVSPSSGPSVKKIYLMPFAPGVAVSKSVGQLKQLLEAKATPVFQLQVAGNTPRKPLPVMLPVVSANTNTAPSVPRTPIRESLGNDIPSKQEIAYDDMDEFPHIDSLVDELDRFDS